jgi:hypothetical protein
MGGPAMRPRIPCRVTARVPISFVIIKTNGEYDRIYENWLTFGDPWRLVKKYPPAAVIVVLVMALAAVVWAALLQRLV